jgi:hypothetical protein
VGPAVMLGSYQSQRTGLVEIKMANDMPRVPGQPGMTIALLYGKYSLVEFTFVIEPSTKQPLPSK